MKIKRYISTIFNGVYILTILLFALDGFTSLETKNQLIKSFAYFGILILTPIILIWNLLILETKKNKVFGAMLPILTLIAIIRIGPMRIVFSSGAWQTQTILYQNEYMNSKKVEFQMQDKGALGYNRRTVEVTYLTCLFMFVHPVDKTINEGMEWTKIDKEVNELGLKSP